MLLSCISTVSPAQVGPSWSTDSWSCMYSRVWLLQPILPGELPPFSLFLYCLSEPRAFLLKQEMTLNVSDCVLMVETDWRRSVLACTGGPNSQPCRRMKEKSHLSHAWQGLSAPEVYLVLFHSLPLDCSYASLQLGVWKLSQRGLMPYGAWDL